MKLNGKILVTVAMMVGSMALATGCNQAGDAQPVAPEESVQNAPVENATTDTASTDGTENAFRYGFGASARVHYSAPHAPPAARYEVVGRPPSARHFWVKGHWSYNGREWLWVGGHWDMQRAGYTYVAPHWDMEHGHYRFMRGHWVRRF